MTSAAGEPHPARRTAAVTDSSRPGDTDLDGTPGRVQVGRGDHTDHRVSPPQPLMQPPLSLLTRSDAVAQILVQKNLMISLGQRVVLASMADEYPGHRTLPPPAATTGCTDCTGRRGSDGRRHLVWRPTSVRYAAMTQSIVPLRSSWTTAISLGPLVIGSCWGHACRWAWRPPTSEVAKPIR